MSQAQQSAEVGPLVEALRRKVNTLEDHLDDVEAENDDLRDRVRTLEQRVPEPSAEEYETLDRPDKATIVAQKLVETAEATNGKASMGYKDVIAVFDGRPSPGHAYDIMELAGERDGYHYGASPSGEKRLTFDLDRVNDPTTLSRRE